LNALAANPRRSDWPVLAAILAITVLSWPHITGLASSMTSAMLAAMPDMKDVKRCICGLAGIWYLAT
jgi:hypothetical protein